MSSYSKIYILVFIIFFSSCGGGESDNSPKTPVNDIPPVIVSHSLEGFAVKGPLVNSDIEVYQIDFSQPDLKGELVALGTTDSEASIVDIKIQEPLMDYYLVLSVSNSSTIDLNTGSEPLLGEMSSIISKTQLENDNSINVTPLTTMILKMAMLRALTEQNIQDEIAQAAALIESQLYFGATKEFDPFTSSTMLTTDADASEVEMILQHRVVVETIYALASYLIEDTDITLSEALELVALDVSDEVIDGYENDNSIGKFVQHPELLNKMLGATLQSMPIPGSDKDGDSNTSDPYLIKEISKLLLDEQIELGTNNISPQLEDGTISFTVVTLSADFDFDGIPDISDMDDDNDSVNDVDDSFPTNASESIDTDIDGVGNNADTDDDNDGVEDSSDNFPLDPLETIDTDIDGVGNNEDTDDDNDGIEDIADFFPLDATEYIDSDSDGVGDNRDAFPKDGNCYESEQGHEELCIVTWLESGDNQLHSVFHMGGPRIGFAVDTDGDNKIEQVLVQNVETQLFETPIVELDATYIEYSETQNRIYYASNTTVGYVDSLGVKQEFASLPDTILGIFAIDNHLLVRDGLGDQGTYHLFDQSSAKIGSQEFNNYSNVNLWSSSNGRLYHFKDCCPEDILYTEINTSTGEFGDQQDSPYNGDYSIRGPIITSFDDASVVTGAGDIYDAQSLSWLGSLGHTFEYGYWSEKNELVTITNTSGQFVLNRRNSELIILEQIVLDGEVLALYHIGNHAIFVNRNASGLYTGIFQPNNDSDNDGTENVLDAFPLDIAASVDSDSDSFPDEWNPGLSATDSTTGLTLDSFPSDSACWFDEHGIDGLCNYFATMPEFIPDEIVYSQDGTVYFYDSNSSKVYRWSQSEQRFLNPISVGENSEISRTSPTLMAYSENHNRLYFGYNSGLITYIDLAQISHEVTALNIAISVTGLTSVGTHMLAQDNFGAWDRHYIFNQDGEITDSKEWNYFSRTYAWNTENSRVYFIRDSQSPRDLHYQEIDQESGRITDEGESPYHSSLGIDHPIRISGDGDKIILGSGRLYDATSISLLGDLSVVAVDMLFSGGTIITLEDIETENLKLWSENTFSLLAKLDVQGIPLALIPTNGDLLVISQLDGKFVFDAIEIADTDGDQLPGWWEVKYGFDDADGADADIDPDEDSLTNIQEFEAGTNPVLADSDADGLSDAIELTAPVTDPLNPDYDADGLLDGEEVNTYSTNPNNQDSDEDGLSDFVEVSEYLTNPLSQDTDNDGMGDLWEINNGLDPIENDADADFDNDTLSNIGEFENETDPTNVDSDFDGLTDGSEVHIHGTDPLKLDSDSDKMSDSYEVQYEFNPLEDIEADLDHDADGFTNMEEYFLRTVPNDAESVPAVSSWNTYQGNGQFSGFIPLTIDETLLAERWRINLTSQGQQVISDSGQIIAVSNDGRGKSIHSLNPVNGISLWDEIYSDTWHMLTPLLTEERVYFGTDEFLRSLNRDTGGLIYRESVSIDSRHLGFVNNADTVFVPNSNIIEAFDPQGESLWRHSLNRTAMATTKDGKLFVASENIEVINIENGSVDYTLVSNHPEDNGFIIPGSEQNILVKQRNWIANYNLNSGMMIWEHEVDNYQITDMALAYGNVYVLDNLLKVYDEFSGELKWSWEPPSRSSLVYNIVVARNMVFVSTRSSTYAISLDTRSTVWTASVAGAKSLSADGALFIATNEEVIAYDLGFDSDGDGLDDWWENYYSLDPNDSIDASLDIDEDGLTALEEFQSLTDPTLLDSDGDGLSDGDEVLTHSSDPNAIDTDLDGLSDFSEVSEHQTNPVMRDSDEDGLADSFEVINNLNPNDSDDAALDIDHDGFSALEEFYLGTDINNDASVPESQPWKTYQANASHNGFVLQTVIPENIEQLWTIEIEHSAQQITSGNGGAYFSDRNESFGNQSRNLVAVDTFTGRERWNFNLDATDNINSTAYSDGKVFVQTGGQQNSYFYGIDAISGEQVFQTSYGNQWSRYLSPTPFGEWVYTAGGSFGGIYSYSSSSGTENFFIELAQVDNWTPTVNESSIFACHSNPVTKILDRQTGEASSTIFNDNWLGCQANTAAVLGSENNLIAQRSGFLTSYDIGNDVINWQVSGVSGQPSVAFGRVYIIRNGLLAVYSEVTGGLLWSYDASSSLTSNIVVTLNKVIVASSSQTFVIDIESQGSVTFSGGGTLSLSEGILFVSNGQKITAYNVDGDDDDDGMLNIWERLFGLDPLSSEDAVTDLDGDGLTNFEEFEVRADPTVSDTDSDGLSDFVEVEETLSDPTTTDTDGDLLSDGDEVNTYLTSPNQTDSDNDGFSDGREVLIYLTNPIDAESFPESITNQGLSFEEMQLSAVWEASEGSSANWILVSGSASDGNQSLRSGGINDSQYSSVEFQGLFAATTLSFDFKVDSEACCDYLELWLDGERIFRSAVNEWTNHIIGLDEGEHVLEWRYVKDGSISRGEDAAWIDNVVFSN